MNFSWVLADNLVLDPTLDIAQLKDLGSMWGSWRTWRGCSTDNVICHDPTKVDELLAKNFHQLCNFYIPNSSYTRLEKPAGVKVYEGSFVDNVVESDEIIAMHLASSTNDIVLLLGFDWRAKPESVDSITNRRNQVYLTLIRNAIRNNPEVQWVLVDHLGELNPELAILENLTQDTMPNILSFLND